MEKYVWIDMFEKLDASLLDELHIEKDLKRHKNRIQTLFAKGYVKTASVVAAISLVVTGALIVFLQVRKKFCCRRPA